MTNEQKRIEHEINTLMTAQNLRTEQAYQKQRNSAALNWLAGILIISIALACLVGYATYQNEQAAKEKETELNCKPVNQ